MASSYTSLLGLVLPVTGELSGVWGQTINDSLTSLLDTAIAGTTTLNTDADVTLSTTTGAANQARQAILLCSGARTARRNITAPAQSKIYTVINNTTGGFAVVLRGAGPTTGVSIPAGKAIQVVWNGSDFVELSPNSITGNLAVSGTLAVTGATTLTGALTANGAVTLGDAAGDAITFNGTTTFANANPTLSAGHANGVAYLNGSKVLTTGSALQFDGSNLGLGGTPSAWVSASVGLQVKGYTALSETTGGDSNLTNNVYLSAPNTWTALASLGASRYQLDFGAHKWYTAPSGTAGNAISFTQAMTLNASGVLSVASSVGTPTNENAGFAVAAINAGTTSVYNWLDSSSMHLWAGATQKTGILITGQTTGSGSTLQFNTGGSERARILSDGRFVVGSTGSVSSSGRLQAVQSEQSNAALSVDATNASYDYNVAYLNTTRTASSDFYFMTCTTGGYGAYQFRFRGDGTIYAQNTIVQSLSDVRVKENIRDSEDGLQVVLGLQPRRFDFKQGFGNDRKNVLGFIAQEIETVFPDAVDTTPVDPDGEGQEEPYKSVGPGALIPVLVKAIQEQQAIIESLTARIAALEAA